LEASGSESDRLTNEAIRQRPPVGELQGIAWEHNRSRTSRRTAATTLIAIDDHFDRSIEIDRKTDRMDRK